MPTQSRKAQVWIKTPTPHSEHGLWHPAETTHHPKPKCQIKMPQAGTGSKQHAPEATCTLCRPPQEVILKTGGVITSKQHAAQNLNTRSKCHHESDVPHAVHQNNSFQARAAVTIRVNIPLQIQTRRAVKHMYRSKHLIPNTACGITLKPHTTLNQNARSKCHRRAPGQNNMHQKPHVPFVVHHKRLFKRRVG